MTTIHLIAPHETPPVIPLDPRYSSVRRGVDVRGVELQLSFTLAPETHVMVCAADPIGGKRISWLGWAVTDQPVVADRVMEIAREMADQLLTRMASVELATAAAEEIRRMHATATAAADADQGSRGRNRGIALGLASAMQVLEVVLDRLGPGFAEIAGQPARDRAAAAPEMSFAEGLAATVGAIHDGLGDQAEIAVLVVGPEPHA